jgi:hypothetical protein
MIQILKLAPYSPLGLSVLCWLTVCPAVIPVIYSSRDDPEEKLRALKRSMQQQEASAKGFGSSSSTQQQQQFQPGAAGSGIGNSEVSLTEDDKKWRLEPTQLEEWEVSGCYRGDCRVRSSARSDIAGFRIWRLQGLRLS